MSKGILVVGSLNMDMSISLDSIPAVGETVLGNDLFYRTGGKGATRHVQPEDWGEMCVCLAALAGMNSVINRLKA